VHSWISRERLEQLYVRDGLTTLEVAERLGSNRESIRKLIHHYELPMRSRGSG
jgi:transposase